MKLLVIDASEPPLEVAVLHKEHIVEKKSEQPIKSGSEEILPMINEVLTKASLALGDLDAIVVANGPGSFTGLRVANAVVKGMSLAFPELPIIALSRLDAALFVVKDTRPIAHYFISTTLMNNDIFFYAVAHRNDIEQKAFDKMERGMMSKKEINHLSQEKQAVVIGGAAYESADVIFSAKHIVPLAKAYLKEKRFVDRELLSPVYKY